MEDYIKDGYFSYTPKLGFPEFREALSRELWKRKAERVPQELILPIDSAARGMYEIAKTFLKPGDEMIVFDPVDYLSASRPRQPGQPWCCIRRGFAMER